MNLIVLQLDYVHVVSIMMEWVIGDFFKWGRGDEWWKEAIFI